MTALNITQLKGLITSEIIANGIGAITGNEVNNVLLQMIATLVEPNQTSITAPGTTTGLTTDGDVLVNAAGAVTYDLVPAATATRPLCIKDMSGNALTNNITIAPSGIETINGSNIPLVIRSNYGSFSLFPLVSGTGWYTK